MNSTGKTPDYIRHTYKVTNELKVIRFMNSMWLEEKNLTDILRIANQGKSKQPELMTI
jgi:hypothetical protein